MEYVTLRSEWRERVKVKECERERERGQRAVLSPYLREQATIYDCRLSIINSYKLLLLLAVCLPQREDRDRKRGKARRQTVRQTDRQGVGRDTTLCTCVCGQLLTTLNNQHDLWER